MSALRSALESARYELRAQLRGASAPLVACCLGALAFAYSNSREYLSDVGAGDLPRNSPYVVYLFSAAPLFIFMYFLAHVASTPLTRDTRHGMAEVMHTTPAGSRPYLIGKWLGVLGAAHVVALAIPLTFCLFPTLAALGVLPRELVGESPLGHIAHAYFFYVSPFTLILGSLFFGLAALTGRAFAAYAASFVISVVWMIAFVVLWEGGVSRVLAEALDPIGWTCVIAQGTYWTAEQKTSAFMELTPGMALNRSLWGSLSVVVLGVGLAWPRTARLITAASGLPAVPDEGTTLGAARIRPPAPSPEPRFDGGAALGTVLGAAWSLFRRTASGALFRGVMALAVLSCAGSLFVYVLKGHEGHRLPWLGLTWPVSFEHGFVLSAFFTVWSAGQLARRERDHHFDPVLDTLPAPAWLLVLPRLLALSAITLVLALMPTLSVLALGLALDPSTVELGPSLLLTLLGSWPAFTALGLLAFIAFALVVERWAAHFVAFAALLVCVMNAEVGLVDHDLALYGLPPTVWYSELTGVTALWRGPLVLAVWFLSLGALGTWLAIELWPRGDDTSLRARLRAALADRSPRRLLVPGGLALVAVAAFLAARHDLTLNGYRSPDEERAEAAEYERRYRSASASPTLERGRLHVVLRPEAGEARVTTTLELRNTGAVALEQIDFDLPDRLLGASVKANGVALVTTRDEALRRVSARLPAPLAPDTTIELGIDGVARYSGFAHGGQPLALSPAGAWLTTDDLLPQLGYDYSRELAAPHERTSRGLGRRQPRPEQHLAFGASPSPAHLELTVEAPPELTLVVPGSRDARGSGSVDGIVDVALAAARFERSASELALPGQTVTVSVLHAPVRQRAALGVLDAAKRALLAFAARYGAYSGERLQIVQVPRELCAARLVGDVLLLPEQLAFDHSPADPDYDYVTLEVARLIARHWFVEQRRLTAAPGAPALASGLPYAVALSLVAEQGGPRVLARHLDRMSERFAEAVAHADGDLTPPERARFSEDAVTLYIGMALYGLRERLGHSAFDGAVREWLAASDPTLGALAARLGALDRAATDEALAELAVWDNRVAWTRLEASGLAASIELRAFAVRGRDFRAREPSPSPITVGLMDERGGVLERHTLESTTPAERVQFEAASGAAIVVDPLRTLVERNPRDNGSAIAGVR